jgi:pimeloyl-ACP methyl ester carboxylesterase
MHHYLSRALRGAAVSPVMLGAALLLGGGVGSARGQAAHLDSLLTSTGTPQVLQLSTDVFPLGNGLFRWQFTLTNPIGNTSRIRFFTAAPNCDLTQISNVLSPPGWAAQVYHNRSESPDGPKINWMVAAGQPGPFSLGTPWLNPVPGQNVKQFSFDLPVGANNQTGQAGALNTFGFSGPTLGCQIGSLSLTGACPPNGSPGTFRVSFNVRFQNRGDVTITISRGGLSQSRTLANLASGSYFVDFSLGSVPSGSEIILINGAAVENGVSFTASATAQITNPIPIVVVPGVAPTDPADSALASGSPSGLLNGLGNGLKGGTFVCPPLIAVAPFCPPNDPIVQAADMLENTIHQALAQTGALKVHLVAHGGGTILARYYLKTRDPGGSTVRSLTLVSPPNLGMLRAILSPNRNSFTRYWPAYPFWKDSPGGRLFFSPQNIFLTQELGTRAPFTVPTLVVYGTGTETPATALGSSTTPYLIENESGDGTVTERSALALEGASGYLALPGLKFTNGLSNPLVSAAITPFILAH